MTTTIQLPRFRSQPSFGPRINISPRTNFRELWADGLATAATMTLFSILVFETLRLLIS